MMRPCDLCGGSSEQQIGVYSFATSSGEDEVQSMPCSRCVDMPKLPCPADYTRPIHEDPHHDYCDGRGWFKPDPDSIMWWCINHAHPAGIKFSACEYENEWGVGRAEECDLGWVERPTRLETL